MSVQRNQNLRCRHPARVSGFTLIELLVVLGISVILVTLAVPGYNSSIQAQKTSGWANNLLADIDYARSEAIKEGQNISMCSSSDGATCSSSSNWNVGWIVTTVNSAGTTVVLRKQAGFAESMATSPTIASAGTLTALTFNRDGFALNIDTTKGQLFTVHSVTTNSNATRCVWLDQLGRPQIQTTSTAAATGQGTNTCT